MAGPETLTHCEKQVKMMLRAHIDDIAFHLYQNEILSERIYKIVTDFQGNIKLENRAHAVYVALKDAVQKDDSTYTLFVDYLRQNPKHYLDITTNLDAQYEAFS